MPVNSHSSRKEVDTIESFLDQIAEQGRFWVIVGCADLGDRSRELKYESQKWIKRG
jgi:hypothetical protein